MHTAPHITYLPVTAYAAASPATAPQDDNLWESPMIAVPTRSLRKDVLLMQIIGDSMDDGTPGGIPHGSYVLVDTADLRFHQLRRGYVYVFVRPDGATVAKIYDLHKGQYVLKSLNPDFEPIQQFRRAGYEPVGLLYGVRESMTKVRSVTGYGV